jgi:hypothetical protein
MRLTGFLAILFTMIYVLSFRGAREISGVYPFLLSKENGGGLIDFLKDNLSHLRKFFAHKPFDLDELLVTKHYKELF